MSWTSARAQELPSTAPAYLQAGLRLTSVHGDIAPLLRGSALVGLSEKLSLGGGGSILLSDRAVEGNVSFPRQLLGFGYGGIVIEIGAFSIGSISSFSARTLLGAGNADLRDLVSGTRIASDNVLVIEPELLLGLPLSPRLQARFGLSYRHAWGVQDLEEVTRGDLSGPSLGVLLRIGPL